MARISGGHTNLAVNPMNARKATICAISVRLKLIRSFPLPCSCGGSPGPGLAERRGERAGEGEEHRDAQADDERGVDQAKQQEHLALKRIGQLRLPCRGLEES